MIRDALILQKRELEKKLEEPYGEREISSRKFENTMIKVIIVGHCSKNPKIISEKPTY